MNARWRRRYSEAWLLDWSISQPAVCASRAKIQCLHILVEDGGLSSAWRLFSSLLCKCSMVGQFKMNIQAKPTKSHARRSGDDCNLLLLIFSMKLRDCSCCGVWLPICFLQGGCFTFPSALQWLSWERGELFKSLTDQMSYEDFSDSCVLLQWKLFDFSPVQLQLVRLLLPLLGQSLGPELGHHIFSEGVS